jgi:hypothetical protein
VNDSRHQACRLRGAAVTDLHLTAVHRDHWGAWTTALGERGRRDYQARDDHNRN